MRTAITSSVAAGMLLLATPLAAQEERLAQINFVKGDNSGALSVAEGLYGRSSILETAILDVDDDGNAEIAVKFTESCKSGVCAMSILKFNEAEWKPVIEDIASSLSLSNTTLDGYKTVYSGSASKWEWTGSRYFPKPIVDIWSYDLASENVTDIELRSSALSGLTEASKVTLPDFSTGKLSIISSQSQFDCFQVSICPAVVMLDDKSLGRLSSQGGTLGVSEDALFTIDKDGYSKYATSGQSLKRIDIKRAGTRITGYQK
ncbi:hypothetical protein [Sulfitobacter sp. R18_1]|uniref:hypothetical protein n=1 Tax=Sulfitobacter sp. R18_1 TaxID=2821104 RepID=UPI001ADAEE59|nr:hypothetical protein [Sulfitobacter sp. R18_1]MBO9428417.1 hypothetical protein [Sulfitobacter sp. R18_1]